MEVCDFCLMDNHFHLILRSRPDWVPLLSDEEVVRRWWHILRQQGEPGLPVDPSPLTMRLWTNNPSQMESYRRRLSDISCFMQRYSEYIARRANREDGQHGKFFEERFKATRLLDDEALLACSMYVNLNPIRAGKVERPEESQYTSAFERIQSLRSYQLVGGNNWSGGQLTEADEIRIAAALSRLSGAVGPGSESSPINSPTPTRPFVPPTGATCNGGCLTTFACSIGRVAKYDGTKRGRFLHPGTNPRAPTAGC